MSRMWEEVEKELFTPEEIEEAKFKAALLDMFLKTRHGAKINMDKFEELSDRVYEDFKNLELVSA